MLISEEFCGRMPRTKPAKPTRYPSKTTDNQYFIFYITLGYFSNPKTDHSGECPKPAKLAAVPQKSLTINIYRSRRGR
jgi:hypothetical protein